MAFVTLRMPMARPLVRPYRSGWQDLSQALTALQVIILTLGKPVFDNSTNDLKYDVSFVPNMRHNSTTSDFYKRHANAPGSPKVVHPAEFVKKHLTFIHLLSVMCSMTSPIRSLPHSLHPADAVSLTKVPIC